MHYFASRCCTKSTDGAPVSRATTRRKMLRLYRLSSTHAVTGELLQTASYLLPCSKAKVLPANAVAGSGRKLNGRMMTDRSEWGLVSETYGRRLNWVAVVG